MPRRREPANGVIPAPRPALRGIWGTYRWREIGLGCVLVVGSSCKGDGSTNGTQRPPGSERRSSVSPFSGIGHVGNQVRGIDAIPDYDDEAQSLRARVQPRLPDPLPSPKAACVSMLDAARQFYVDTEGESSSAVKTMAATRDADLPACVEHTGSAAAACVAVLMAQSEGEFPWVLDQCSRAFPITTKG